MATILKKDVTLESIEEQVKRLQSYIDSRKEDLKEIEKEKSKDKEIEY